MADVQQGNNNIRVLSYTILFMQADPAEFLDIRFCSRYTGESAYEHNNKVNRDLGVEARRIWTRIINNLGCCSLSFLQDDVTTTLDIQIEDETKVQIAFIALLKRHYYTSVLLSVAMISSYVDFRDYIYGLWIQLSDCINASKEVFEFQRLLDLGLKRRTKEGSFVGKALVTYAL
ncbi:hypothetical protein M514_23717 [Trichuris suis]|uniref:Uncharacterized protein n=1 Tax=Trichuris suis TaxID=68888 RepID=A0A085N3U0_9BILA|nr:hypothetical protein M514_23717 [Trichuris suis]